MAMRLSQKRSETATPHSAPSPYARPFVVQRRSEDSEQASPEAGVSLLNNRYQVGATPNYQPDWIARSQAKGALGIQRKVAIGQPNDKYEQEADRVAEQVMGMPDAKPAVQREGMPGEEEEVQAKSLGGAIQREVMPEEEEIQAKPLSAAITPLVQREAVPEEEEEVQAKSLGGSIQREVVPEEEEEPIQAKLIQREAMAGEEEEIQAKRSSGGGLEAGGDFESRLSSSKSGGSPLPEDVRSFMEPRFGADFSGVRVHTGSEAVQMNREVGAQAFAHGQDVYFGEGKGPGKDALTAHELTHVVQQNQLIQCKDVNLIQRGSSPPSGPTPKPRRRDLVFIMGEDNPGSNNKFYTAAEKYWRQNAPQALIIQSSSLEYIFAWLRAVTVIVGNLYIVSHANADGTLSFKLDASDKDKKISYGELKQALKNKAALFKLPAQLIDRDSTIHIKGCNLGRSQAMLDTLGQAFGGNSKVTAPKHKQNYSYQSTSTGKGKNRKVEEKTQEFFSTLFIERIGKAKISRAEQLAEFKAKYADLGWKDKTWESLIPKQGVKPLVNEPYRFTYPVGNNPEPSDETVINEAKKEFAKDPDHELSRPDIYAWRVERNGKGKSFKMIAILSMTSYEIKKDLKDSDGNMIHPDEKTGSYFGESTNKPLKSP